MISDNPLVSIAIPAYNCSKFIAACLRSIHTQTYKNYEIIIVDDCSTDNSASMIERAVNFYRLRNKTKLFSHSVNYGCGMTEKHAIEFGSGELVVILDSDDALASYETLKLLVVAHQENPDASLVYSDYYNCDEKLRVRKIRKCTHKKGSQSYLGFFKPDGKYVESNITISHVKCFKRSFYDKTEGIDPNLLKSVDKDLVLKLEEVGEFFHIPIPLYYHRHHSQSISYTFSRKSKAEQNKINELRIEMLRKTVERRMKKMKELKEKELNHENI